jgi:glycosyltransferase involved in cell wall biosynthesis
VHEDRVVYVGMSKDVFRRFFEHRRESKWAAGMAKQFDRVVCYTLASFVAAHGALNANVWTTMYIHESEEGGSKSARVNPLIQDVLKRANNVVYCSEHNQHEFSPYRKGPVLRIGVEDPTTLIPAPETTSDGKNVLVLGSFEARKGLDFVAAVAKKCPNVTFNIIGRILDNGLFGMISQQNIPNFKYLGQADPAGALKALAQCDVLFVPSRDETIPTVILEAMFYSKPVVASNVGGIPEAVIHEKTGLLVEVGNVDAYAEAITKMTKFGHLRELYGKAGREVALENFTLERFAQSIDALV